MLLRSIPAFIVRPKSRLLKTLKLEGGRILEIMGSKPFLLQVKTVRVKGDREPPHDHVAHWWQD